MKKITVINGPNLNFLGIRKKSIYGHETYETLVAMIKNKAEQLKIGVDVFQSNSEGAIIDKLQKCYMDHVDGIVINPGAYTHYSYAIRDAIESISIPTIEVHISNIYERETFRHTSVTKCVCMDQIFGKGLDGYCMAMEKLIEL